MAFGVGVGVVFLGVSLGVSLGGKGWNEGEWDGI